MRDIEEIKQDLSYDASWWQPADLHSIACDLLAEVERLHTANRLLLEERAAVRKSLGEHFIAITDEQGNPTDSAYYMDQGVEMLATQWQFSQDQLERAHQELAEAKAEVERLRSLLAPIIVPCERCGRKVRGNIERVCQVCADENWSLNRD